MTLSDPSPRQFRFLSFCGIAGGLLYVTGDLLFYGRWSYGPVARTMTVMATRSDATLIAGGVVAPLASTLYALGTVAVYFALRQGRPLLARVFVVGWIGMFLTGIGYHSVFTVLGFVAKVGEPTTREIPSGQAHSLLNALYVQEIICGGIGTVCFVVAVLRGATGCPRWLVLFTPTVWALLDFLPRAIGPPLGGVLSGGWINGWFTAFFSANFLASAQRASGSRALDSFDFTGGSRD